MNLDSKLEIRLRTEFGWETQRDPGGFGLMSGGGGETMALASSPSNAQTCSVTAAPGKLCALSSAWWSSVGRALCGATTMECEGSSGELLASTKLSGAGAPVIAADIDGSSVWVVRAQTLQRWHLAETFAPDGSIALSSKLVFSKALGSTVRDLRARTGQALIATDTGVLRARATATGFDVDPVLSACGAPLKVEPLGADLWAVATTKGLVFLGGPLEGALDVLSMLLHVDGELVPVTGASALACASADAGKLGTMTAQTALAADGPAHVLAAFGKTLFVVDASDATAATPTGSLALGEPISALRVEAVGRRAYAIGTKSGSRPVFGLEPALSASGAHEAGNWVRRREAAEVMMRMTAQQVEIARVAR